MKGRTTWFFLATLLAAAMLALAACGGDDDGGEAADTSAGGQKDKVTLQSKWVPQAQFAGYYAALAKGYYEEEGLDVTIKPGGPDITPEQVFARSGMTEVTWKDSGIESVADMRGKKVGVWCCGNEFELFAALTKNGIDPKNKDEVTIVNQPFDMSLFISKQVDAAAAMTYNELAQVLEQKNPDTGELYTLDDLNVITMEDAGTAMLEDGVFVRGDWIAEEANQDIAKRFLKASFRGWIFCRDNAEECLQIVLDNGPTLGEGHQRWQLNEINALIWPNDSGIGIMDEAAFQRTADISKQFGVIAKDATSDAYRTDLDMPFGGTVTIDDVESGQTAAAFGGTTCHVDFVIQPQGSTFAAALDEWRSKADGKQVIDMGYHMAVTDLREGGTLEELASLPDQGVTSYKLFMAYKGALMVDDETLFRTMEVAAETRALVMVHAENGDAIDVLVKQALAEGKTEPKYHALTRPPETEGEATNRAIQLARVAGSPLYVVHVSCQESVEPIALAREKGWDVWGETCTQYFFVDYTFLEKPNFEGAKYVYTPPPRPKANQDVLWNAVRTDILSAISTDHCAFLWDGQKTLGRDDFSKIPNGGPGLENRLHMIHEFGVRAGRISLHRMVELLSTNPAKLFGLYPRKGTIAVGSDADIVVFDPERKHLITAADQESRTDYNLYEGTEVVGDVETVLLRGSVIVDSGEVVAKPGIGRFIARAKFGEQLRAQPIGAPT